VSATTWKVLVLVVGVGALTTVSWRSLRTLRFHGFPRLILFVSDLSLVVLNAERWFTDPFSPLQLLSWVLLFGSIPVALAGFLTIQRHGQPAERTPENANFAWENTGRLVQRGIYQYIRHPMYSSLLMFLWGAFCKDPSILGLAIAAIGTAAGFATAILEEREDVASFGEEYVAYLGHTRRFVPYVV
jgi:protein-S-isoprenylcysteine O-methyltransferase Ste14